MADLSPSGLTGAEIALLRALPQRIAPQPSDRGDTATARRRRLQAAGLLTVRWDAGQGCFLVMLTPAGAAALAGAR